MIENEFTCEGKLPKIIILELNQREAIFLSSFAAIGSNIFREKADVETIKRLYLYSEALPKELFNATMVSLSLKLLHLSQNIL